MQQELNRDGGDGGESSIGGGRCMLDYENHRTRKKKRRSAFERLSHYSLVSMNPSTS